MILPGGIVLIDEPAGCAMNTFAGTGELLLSFNCRPGGNCGQVIIGLTAWQATQLIERLQKYEDVYKKVIVAGKGGAKFEEGK
jgi:hypothetical protein